MIQWSRIRAVVSRHMLVRIARQWHTQTIYWISVIDYHSLSDVADHTWSRVIRNKLLRLRMFRDSCKLYFRDRYLLRHQWNSLLSVLCGINANALMRTRMTPLWAAVFCARHAMFHGIYNVLCLCIFRYTLLIFITILWPLCSFATRQRNRTRNITWCRLTFVITLPESLLNILKCSHRPEGLLKLTEN